MRSVSDWTRRPCRPAWLLGAALALGACGDGGSSGKQDQAGPVDNQSPAGAPDTPDTPDPEWITQITVIKHVKFGGAVASDFQMVVTVNGVALDPFDGSETGTTVNVPAGTYSVGETGPEGYAAAYSADCSGTIADGEHKYCTVTNTATDKCAGVVCVRWDADCGGVGECNPETGQCEYPYVPPGTPCTDDGNECTADFCNDRFYCVHPPLPEGTLCREAKGLCDVPEVCDGESPVCPPDEVAPAETECRESADGCDVAEYCTGEDKDCPEDEYAPAGTVCHPAEGRCDVAEECTGRSPYCPPDELAPPTQICRTVADGCDVAEYCTGEDVTCPEDEYAPAGTVCRPAEGDCDIAEECTGTSPYCPRDVVGVCQLCGHKFYDGNVNGEYDTDEMGLGDWTIQLKQDGTVVDTLTDEDGSYLFEDVAPGDYEVCEANLEGWIQTAPEEGCYDVHVPFVGADECDLDFGNVCLERRGAKTKGFWQSKNGEEVFKAGDGGTSALALLVSLNLVESDGTPFDPTSYEEFEAWLDGASATNMAYMLSAQLAAMSLNVWAHFVGGYMLVYAPDVDAADALGFVTIDDLLAEADDLLGEDGYTPAGDPNRHEQEDVKDAIDAANNNLTFVSYDDCREIVVK